MKTYKALIIVAIGLAIITVPHFFISDGNMRAAAMLYTLLIAILVVTYLPY